MACSWVRFEMTGCAVMVARPFQFAGAERVNSGSGGAAMAEGLDASRMANAHAEMDKRNFRLGMSFICEI